MGKLKSRPLNHCLYSDLSFSVLLYVQFVFFFQQEYVCVCIYIYKLNLPLPPNAGDPALIPGSGRSLGEGNGNPLQYSSLENPMDRGASQAAIHGVAELDTTEHAHVPQFKLHPFCLLIGLSIFNVFFQPNHVAFKLLVP